MEYGQKMRTVLYGESIYDPSVVLPLAIISKQMIIALAEKVNYEK